MQYFVVIGREGPQIEEILDELLRSLLQLVPYHFGQAGFNSRPAAEDCLNILKAQLPSPSVNTDEDLDRYPNSSTHWEESGEAPLPMPLSPSTTPSPSPCLPTVLSATVDIAPENQNQAPRADLIELSEEQNQVLETVKAGGNVFFTGPAGTGKSLLLREIIEALRSMRKRVAVTASTGIAGMRRH
ncbi:hypothetical protein J3R30DRAFT_310635 [Lentinula aciculospora]|uniref:ATP-dependent DNA helicase n=1 Tax=Lentinula aciculospora TaxID=153920 RepID=A0A9W9A7Y9_9AGAR|nr:hypothetical protein J3R30DRAFT_310635 [Lentinula aciculospora]